MLTSHRQLVPGSCFPRNTGKCSCPFNLGSEPFLGATRGVRGTSRNSARIHAPILEKLLGGSLPKLLSFATWTITTPEHPSGSEIPSIPEAHTLFLAY